MVSHLGPRPPEPPNKTDKWLRPKELGAMLGLDRHTVVNYGKFDTHLFPRPYMRGQFYFWKLKEILLWKYKRIAAIKRCVHGLR